MAASRWVPPETPLVRHVVVLVWISCLSTRASGSAETASAAVLRLEYFPRSVVYEPRICVSAGSTKRICCSYVRLLVPHNAIGMPSDDDGGDDRVDAELTGELHFGGGFVRKASAATADEEAPAERHRTKKEVSSPLCLQPVSAPAVVWLKEGVQARRMCV